MSQPNSHERLIALVTDRQLAEPTPEAVRELEGLLQSSFSARRLYIELINLQGHLETLLTQQTTEDVVHGLDTEEIFAMLRQAEDAAPDVAAAWQVSELRIGPASDDQPTLTLSDTASAVSYLVRQQVERQRVFLGVVAALLVIGVALALSFLSGPDEPDQAGPMAVTPQDEPAAVAAASVATLTAEHNAVWDQKPGGDHRPGTSSPGVLRPGDPLTAGQHLTLASGFAEITTEEGAIVILEAPATVELLDNNALRLHAGKLVGICETESSKGFVVRTPHLDITDLGTRFGVDVMPYRSTEVHVHQGEVVVATPNMHSDTKTTQQHIKSGQAMRCEGAENSITSITPSFEKFNEALRVYRLRGTGFGLAEGAIDPQWQIVAGANGPLDQPQKIVVQRSKREGSAHYPAIDNDPARAQWLFYMGKKTPYYPLEPSADLDPTRVVYESRVTVPDNVDLNDTVLAMRIAGMEGFHAIHLNGQALERVPVIGSSGGKVIFHDIEWPIDQTGLRHGENVIRVDMKNNFTPDIASFYLEWEIRPEQLNASPN